jgi:hypothetical protein
MNGRSFRRRNHLNILWLGFGRTWDGINPGLRKGLSFCTQITRDEITKLESRRGAGVGRQRGDLESNRLDWG